MSVRALRTLRLAALLALLLPSGVAWPVPLPSVARVARTAVSPPLLVIVMENHEYGAVVGSSSARYLNRRFIPSGTLFTNYHAVEHPSLPNYLDMTSGRDSGCHSDTCPRRSYRTDNIFHQLTAADVAWRAWQESMPRRCAVDTSGRYAVKHDPATYYANLFPHTCRASVVPYPSPMPEELKPFTFVTPNVCSDMHDCSVAHGDRWLRDHVPDLLNRGAVVVVTFDEGSTSAGGGGHVMTAVSGPDVPEGVRNGRSFDHFGLLAGIEDRFGVRRLHGAKATHRLPLPSP
jgi:hypothetical protein